MIKKLLVLSLIAIPFYEVLLYFFIPNRHMPMLPDMRFTKDFVSWISAITIGSTVLFFHGFKAMKPKWIYVFLIFLVYNIFKAPGSFENVSGVNFSGMWNYQPALKCFVFFFLFCGISSIEWKQKQVNLIYKVIMWCGVVASALMIMQRFGIDQIFTIADARATNAQMGGPVGQPTLSAPFVVMTIPFAIYFKKYIYVFLMCCCVILSESAFAIAGMCLIPFVFLKNKSRYALFLCLCAALVYFLKPDLFESNGRFDFWPIVWKSFLVNKMHYTGAGIGSFKYLFAVANNRLAYQAHNEYLQILWTMGIIGTGVFFMIVKDFWKHANVHLKAVILPVLFICLGTFPLQLAVFQFYLTVLAGLSYAEIKK